MKGKALGRQAAVLACANGLVRALGFGLHVLLSRLLGAEALGVMELSHSAHMLSIVPVTAGIPAAISRLTALRKDDSPLRAGREAVLRLSAVLFPLWLLLAPGIARLLGDPRTLLPLWAFTPCIALLGLTAVYSGYCYGLGRVWPPALGALTEQGLRFLLSALLLLLLPGMAVTERASLPGLAEAAAAAASAALMLLLLRRANLPKGQSSLALRREILRLSLPLTLTRLLQSASRALSAALLPRLLLAAGHTAAEAASAVGMLHGMVLPVLFLPGIVTGAVGMVGTPAIARRQGDGLRYTALRLLAASLACGLGGWGAVRLLSGFLAERVYRLPELAGLFRAAAPLTLLFALRQGTATLLSGLGQQKRTLLPALLEAALTLALMVRWAGALGVYGALYAMLLGRAAALLWELAQALPLLRETVSLPHRQS